MPLHFDPAWRFTPPSDGKFSNSSMPRSAVDECIAMILQVAKQRSQFALQPYDQSVLEHFKWYFCVASGTTHVRSSSASWAEMDLRQDAYRASDNAPLFIEAFYDACESFPDQDILVPNVDMMNAVLSKHDIGFVIHPPDLILKETEAPLVAVKETVPTLAEQAVEVINQSLRRSEKLLLEGHPREAVQEALWLLETVSTAFRGVDTGINSIEGNYFNQIVRELRRLNQGPTFNRILSWMNAMHGYLSSPKGGGVRHGADLNDGVAITLNEARLLCNLIRSYTSFLLVEHDRLAKK